MRVYVVTSGEYSDYSILAMFSTKVKAKRYVEEFNKQSYRYPAEIEDWVLDEDENKVYKTAYCCRIVLADGYIDREWTCDILAPRNKRSEEPQEFDGKVVVRSLVSADHARKLAAEARQASLRCINVAQNQPKNEGAR